MEDQPADPGDLTTDAPEVAEQAAEPTRPRRRFSLRRKAKAAEAAVETGAGSAESAPDEPVTDEPEAAARRPVGKSRRGTSEPAETPADDVTVAPDEATGDDTADDAADDADAVDAPDDDRILVPHRPAGKRLTIAAAIAALLFVGAAGFAGATVQPYLADRAAVDTKLDVARTAADAISTLWTYTPENMESLPDRAARFLGGDFAEEYRKYIDAIVAPNKQAQVTNTTQVMGAAVESLGPTEATAIVYTNSVATSPVTKNIPSLRYLSYRLTMQRQDARWLITRMSTITSFDLTPQL